MRSEPTVARSLPTGRLRKAAVLLAAMLLVALFTVIGTATAADAHDELAGSNPEEGASVEQVPETIELTFTNVPAAIGSEIQILDASGENWSEGAVSITDAVATQAVRAGAPAGEYTVSWRVVSSDAHPIEGTFAFTATEAAAAGEEAPGASVGTAGPIEPGEPEALDSETASESGFPWGITIMISVLVVLAVVLAVGARRRLKQGTSESA